MVILQIQKKILKNTKKYKKSNNIHFELSKRFSPLHNDDQNLTTKRATSTVLKIPEKIPADSRSISLYATNTV